MLLLNTNAHLSIDAPKMIPFREHSNWYWKYTTEDSMTHFPSLAQL